MATGAGDAATGLDRTRYQCARDTLQLERQLEVSVSMEETPTAMEQVAE